MPRGGAFLQHKRRPGWRLVLAARCGPSGRAEGPGALPPCVSGATEFLNHTHATAGHAAPVQDGHIHFIHVSGYRDPRFLQLVIPWLERDLRLVVGPRESAQSGHLQRRNRHQAQSCPKTPTQTAPPRRPQKELRLREELKQEVGAWPRPRGRTVGRAAPASWGASGLTVPIRGCSALPRAGEVTRGPRIASRRRDVGDGRGARALGEARDGPLRRGNVWLPVPVLPCGWGSQSAGLRKPCSPSRPPRQPSASAHGVGAGHLQLGDGVGAGHLRRGRPRGRSGPDEARPLCPSGSRAADRWASLYVSGDPEPHSALS